MAAYDLRHHGPAESDQNHRRDKLVHGRTGVASTVNAHGGTLAILGKPARHIGGADGERAPRQADKQSNRQEVPELGGVAHHPDGWHSQCHEDGHHDASTEPVGPDAQWDADQRSRQHRCGHQQSELGGVQIEHLLDGDADDAEHHPDHEAHREGKGADNQHRPGLP